MYKCAISELLLYVNILWKHFVIENMGVNHKTKCMAFSDGRVEREVRVEGYFRPVI